MSFRDSRRLSASASSSNAFSFVAISFVLDSHSLSSASCNLLHSAGISSPARSRFTPPRSDTNTLRIAISTCPPATVTAPTALNSRTWCNASAEWSTRPTARSGRRDGMSRFAPAVGGRTRVKSSNTFGGSFPRTSYVTDFESSATRVALNELPSISACTTVRNRVLSSAVRFDRSPSERIGMSWPSTLIITRRWSHLLAGI